MLEAQRGMEGGATVTVRPGKRRMQDIVADLHAKRAPNALDPELVPTDRIMQRWAVSVGGGLPTDSWDDTPEAKPPALDDDTAIKVDRIVQHGLNAKYHKLAVRWYKSPAPRQQIAQEMGLGSRTSLYLEWRSLLWYLRGRFHGVGIDC